MPGDLGAFDRRRAASDLVNDLQQSSACEVEEISAHAVALSHPSPHATPGLHGFCARQGGALGRRGRDKVGGSPRTPTQSFVKNDLSCSSHDCSNLAA
jgi:hypothetical protein